ncbi:hypothetical protein V6N11_054576 [Hibiscus sabdariffa]|uniref:Uncharacterized protein n=1 Tax=Hibiscus sabdariffa TaxID=183260 RepID=A0ABR2S4B6_9ROSI
MQVVLLIVIYNRLRSRPYVICHNLSKIGKSGYLHIDEGHVNCYDSVVFYVGMAKHSLPPSDPHAVTQLSPVGFHFEVSSFPRRSFPSFTLAVSHLPPSKLAGLRQQAKPDNFVSSPNMISVSRAMGRKQYASDWNVLHDGKVDMLKMREAMAHWITMHDHPFSIVEEERFNLMMKRGMLQWTSVSRVTIRSDSFKVYEFEKLKLKVLLKKVDRISLTTDFWKSKPQEIEYMVLTAYFVDLDWKLQKRVLNFVHL